MSKPSSPEAKWPQIAGDVLADESAALFRQWLSDHPDAGPQRDFVTQLLESLGRAG